MDDGDHLGAPLKDFCKSHHKSDIGSGTKFKMWVAVSIVQVEANYANSGYTYDACSFREENGRVCSISSFRVNRTKCDMAGGKGFNYDSLASPSQSKGDRSQLPTSHKCGEIAPYKKAWWFFLHVKDAFDSHDKIVEKCSCFQPASDLLGDATFFENNMNVATKIAHVKRLKGKSFRMLLEFSDFDELRNCHARVVQVRPVEKVPRVISLESSDLEYEDVAEDLESVPSDPFSEEIEALLKKAADLKLAMATTSTSKEKKAAKDKNSRRK